MPKIPLPSRRLLRIALPAAVVAAAVGVVPATASAGPVFPTANDDPTGLVIHKAPGSASPRVGKVPSGGKVEVLCQTNGTTESDPKYGTTNIWDKVKNLRDGRVGFVTDLYVLSNQNRIAGVGACGSTPPPPPPGQAAKPSWVPPQYWTILQEAATKERLNPKLLAAQLQIESGFNPTVCSEAGACGIAQFLPGTWRGSWNPYGNIRRGYLDPRFAIPAQARYMRRLLDRARNEDGAAIRRRLVRRDDIPRETINAINFNDSYQIALMAYHGGWDLSGWGPRTSSYPVKITAQARVP
jgi:hypothetical protein